MSTALESPPLKATPLEMPFDLTIDLFTRMVELDVFPRDLRVFLLEGRLFEKVPKTEAHGYVGAKVNMTLARRLPDGWSLWPESTVVLDPRNAPLPDFAVIRGANPLDFGSPPRYPVPGDVGMLIEVAVSSLRIDLTASLERYARASIATYWVIDVVGRRILAHSEPHIVEGRGAYARVETHVAGQSIPLVLDGQEVARIPFEDLLR